MVEKEVLNAQCSKCNHEWQPYGLTLMVIPLETVVTCPKCGNTEKQMWGDEETRKKYFQKQLGLLSNDTEKEINAIKKKNELLRQELDLEKKRHELFEKRVSLIENWKNERERDFQIIEQFAKEIEDEDQFKKDNI